MDCRPCWRWGKTVAVGVWVGLSLEVARDHWWLRWKRGHSSSCVLVIFFSLWYTNEARCLNGATLDASLCRSIFLNSWVIWEASYHPFCVEGMGLVERGGWLYCCDKLLYELNEEGIETAYSPRSLVFSSNILFLDSRFSRQIKCVRVCLNVRTCDCVCASVCVRARVWVCLWRAGACVCARARIVCRNFNW